MRAEPKHDEYLERWTKIYDDLNYSNRSLSNVLLRKSHAWLEEMFRPDDFFARVVEVGSGAGEHLEFVRHRFDQYVITDATPGMLERARTKWAGDRRKIDFRQEDACKLSFPDDSFDRLIATHVLEHLPEPHRVLREWTRVLKDGGALSLVLPCDPGLMWRAGRMLGPRKQAERAGLEYDYWMAREHINSISNLVTFVRYYFPNYHESWRPFLIPSVDLNLFYVCNIRVEKTRSGQT